MRFFLNIKFLLVLFIFSYVQNSPAVVEEKRSLVPTSQIHSTAELELEMRKFGLTKDQWNANRKADLQNTLSQGGAHRRKAQALLKTDQEWVVTMGVITANLNPTKKEEVANLVEKFVNNARSSKIQSERIALLKTLVLGPVEKGTGSSSQHEHLQGKAVLMEFTDPEDRLSLIRALQKKSEEDATRALQQAHKFLNQNTNVEDRALITHSFVSFEDPFQGDDFSDDLKELKKSKRLNGRMIFRAAQAWQQDRLELLRSWKHLMSFGDLRQAKDRVLETFLSLPSNTRKAFLDLLPKGLSASRHRMRGVHKILEAEDTLDEKIQAIKNLSELQKQSPDEYGRTIDTISREAPPAPSSDEASSSEGEGSNDSRENPRKKLIKKHLPRLDESDESGHYSDSDSE